MAEPASTDAQRYFVGVGGEQTGPYSEAEIIGKIRRGEIPTDSLVWFEGLTEWQAIQSIPAFGNAFSDEPQTQSGMAELPTNVVGQDPPPPTSNVGFKPLGGSAQSVSEQPAAATGPTPTPVVASASLANFGQNKIGGSPGQPEVSTFADGRAEPVFSHAEAVFAAPLSDRIRKPLVLGALALAAAAGGYFYMGGEDTSLKVKEGAVPKIVGAVAEQRAREKALTDAQSQLLVSPQASIAAMKKIAQDKADDTAGKQAIEAIVQYYRMRQPAEAGRFLMSVKRPSEAVEYFLREPVIAEEAEQALSSAIAVETDPQKKKSFLISDIELLLGPLSKRDLAVARIREFIREFPSEPNPYAYYLKTTEEKLRDIFGRVAFVYTKTLSGYIDSELSQVNLVKKPEVELRKEKSGKYRLTASYKGEVHLKQDRLNNIAFEFWYVANHWELVSTNLTDERAKWTRARKEKFSAADLSDNEMLVQLEQDFRTQFPKIGLHEDPPPVETSPTWK
jgi:hypothetical protein